MLINLLRVIRVHFPKKINLFPFFMLQLRAFIYKSPEYFRFFSQNVRMASGKLVSRKNKNKIYILYCKRVGDCYQKLLERTRAALPQLPILYFYYIAKNIDFYYKISTFSCNGFFRKTQDPDIVLSKNYFYID